MFLNPETVESLKKQKEELMENLIKIDKKIESFKLIRQLMVFGIQRINNLLIEKVKHA